MSIVLLSNNIINKFSNPYSTPFNDGFLLRLKDTKTGKYVGLTGNQLVETTFANAITFRVKNDSSVYNNNLGGIALQAVSGTNFNNNYMRHAFLNMFCDPFDSNNLDFAWLFLPVNGTYNTFTIYNYYDVNYYVDYNESNLLISQNIPNRRWIVEGVNIPLSCFNYIPPRVVTGGTITTDGNYTIHTFTESGTFSTNMNLKVDVLVVGGGGSGGFDSSGGGGAGGYLLYSDTLTGNNAGNSLLLNTGTYNITVGKGGVGGSFYIPAKKGGDSFISGVTATAFGGGAAHGNSGTEGMDGGSGGGGGLGGVGGVGGTGVAGQGNAGGTSTTDGGGRRHGGGGGAGAVGGNGGTGTTYTGGNGGIGIQNAITGTMTYYAGGGGGGGNAPGAGGLGGGGNAHGGNGTNGLGGGGGGSLIGGGNGGSGGSGIVIIRYQ